MVNKLMCRPTVVLEDVVVLRPACLHEFLDNREDLAQLIIGNVCKFGAVVLRDDQLFHE